MVALGTSSLVAQGPSSAAATREIRPAPADTGQSTVRRVPIGARVGLAQLTCRAIALERSVVFRYDAQLDPWSLPALADAGALIAQLRDVRVRVEADDAWHDPNRAVNVSERRAAEVMQRLVAAGAPPDLLTFRGLGDQRVTPASAAPRGVRLVLVDPPWSCDADPASADADGDGLPDTVDACPSEPEDFDGARDEDGCPEPERGHVSLGCADLTLDRPIRFRGRSATLTPESSARLAAVAELLRHAPFVRVVVIDERVHHDPRRREPLPDVRAQAVRAALIDAGVSPDRLVARVSSVLGTVPRGYDIRLAVYERGVPWPQADDPTCDPGRRRSRAR
ncbi:MAG: hypothetical protein R3B40_27465 [Polyangiales bacterium]